MFDPKSDYALNKKDPDAIVYGILTVDDPENTAGTAGGGSGSAGSGGDAGGESGK